MILVNEVCIGHLMPRGIPMISEDIPGVNSSRRILRGDCNKCKKDEDNTSCPGYRPVYLTTNNGESGNGHIYKTGQSIGILSREEAIKRIVENNGH